MADDLKTTADQRKAALMEYRGALEALSSAAAMADTLLHRSLLPQSFKGAFLDGWRFASSVDKRLEDVDAALDFLEGTDRLKRSP